MSGTKSRRALAILGSLAIAIPAAGLAGCGDDTEGQVNDAIDNAREEIDQAADEAREEADNLEEEIREQIDEATGGDSTSTTEDSTSTTEDSTSTTTEDSGGVGYTP